MGLYDVEECAGIKERSKPTDALRIRPDWEGGESRRHVEGQGGFFDDDKEGGDPNPSIGDLGGPPFSRGGGVNNAKRGGSEKGWEMDGGDGLQWRQVLDQEWNPRCGNGR